jgi:hypothetical protein
MPRPCAHCGEPFQPRPQVPDQAYCSSRDCQRARKRLWQRAKLRSDPDYRHNQRSAQRAWLERNPDYWRNYRHAHPDYAQRNRKRQRLRDIAERGVRLAKMDASDLPAGTYRIKRAAVLTRASRNSWLFEITPL